MNIEIQSSTDAVLTGVATASGATIDLTGSTVVAEIQVGDNSPVSLNANLTNAVVGEFSLVIARSVTTGWSPGHTGKLRLTRVLGDGTVEAFGVASLKVT